MGAENLVRREINVSWQQLGEDTLGKLRKLLGEDMNIHPVALCFPEDPGDRESSRKIYVLLDFVANWEYSDNVRVTRCVGEKADVIVFTSPDNVTCLGFTDIRSKIVVGANKILTVLDYGMIPFESGD